MPEVVNLSRWFEPVQIGRALSRLWVVDGCKLIPIHDDHGRLAECPISLDTILNPVLISDGSVYEELEILRWIRTNDRAPCSNVHLIHKRVLRLEYFKNVIESFLQRGASKNPEDVLRDRLREATSSSAPASIRLCELEEHIAIAEARLCAFHETISEAKAVASSFRTEIPFVWKRDICVSLFSATAKRLAAQQHVNRLRCVSHVSRLRIEILPNHHAGRPRQGQPLQMHRTSDLEGLEEMVSVDV